MISVQQLRFAYPDGECGLSVENFSAGEGEVVGIAGPSGIGKTTFLRLLSGLLLPREGRVEVNGESLSSLPDGARRKLRLRQCGLVFQDFELLDYLTVEDNVLLPIRLAEALTPERRERGRKLIEALDMGHHWQRLTRELSQGERQRVAIARALVHEPKAVLADEPTSSLDERRKLLAMDLLVGYAKEQGAALIVVSHDTDLFQRADRVLSVEDWKS